MACDVNIGMCAEGSHARREMNKTATASKKFGSDVMKGFKQLAGAATIAGGAYLALRKMTEFIKGSFKAYAEYEKQLALLNATLISTGGAADLSRDELIKMANEFQKVTTISNTTALEAQGVMLTFTKIGKEVFPEALEAAANMSERFGQDLRQSMIQLGTALNDPIQGVGRLRRIGISFTEQQKEQIKTLMEANDILGAQAVILDELETELGGMARAARDTFSGAIKALKNNFSDLKRTLGGLMTEGGGLKDFVAKINEFLENETNMRNIVRVFQSLGLVMITSFRVSIFMIKTFINSLKMLWQGVVDVGNAIKIVFDPRNWKPGAMKKAFKDFQWTVADTARDIAADAVKLAEQTRDSFMKILSPELPKLAEKGLKEVSASMKEIVIEAEKLDETIYHGFGNLRQYNKMAMEAADSQLFFAAATADATTSLGKQLTTLEKLNHAMYDYKSSADIALEEQKKIADAQEELHGQLSYVADSAFGLYQQGLRNQTIAMDNWYEHQKELIEATVTDEDVKAQKLKELDEEYGKRRRKLAEQEKAMNVFQSIIDTASGVTKALAQGGFIFGIPWAAVVGAMGAVQTAMIAAQPIPAYQQGGTVPGGYGGGDSQITRTEPGEMIITKENVRRNRALLNQIQSGTAQFTIPVYIGSKLIYKEITKAINETQEIKIRAR